MHALRLYDLKKYDVALITNEKNNVQKDVLLTLLYMKGISFYHAHITSKQGEDYIISDLENLGIDVLRENLSPSIFLPRHNPMVNSFVFTKNIAIATIDDYFIANTAFPSSLSIWRKETDMNLPIAKAALNMHIHDMDQLFDSKFEKYIKGMLTPDIEKEYEALIAKAFELRAKAHIEESTFALCEEVNALDLHYVAIITRILNKRPEFFNKKELEKWKDYHDHAMSMKIFKETKFHIPNIEI
jgi:maleate cis-trans isomerase